LIKGCQSQVWLDAKKADGRVYFYADSDSLITKGMIALFINVLNGEKADDILTADMGFIEKTGLKEHLAPTRANALNLMATQMKQRALGFA
jgi:cysteine desulfuration protein SufE